MPKLNTIIIWHLSLNGMCINIRDCETVTITIKVLLFVEKDGVGPSSFHTELEGPREFVNASRWM